MTGIQKVYIRLTRRINIWAVLYVNHCWIAKEVHYSLLYVFKSIYYRNDPLHMFIESKIKDLILVETSQFLKVCERNE